MNLYQLYRVIAKKTANYYIFVVLEVEPKK